MLTIAVTNATNHPIAIQYRDGSNPVLEEMFIPRVLLKPVTFANESLKRSFLEGASSFIQRNELIIGDKAQVLTESKIVELSEAYTEAAEKRDLDTLNAVDKALDPIITSLENSVASSGAYMEVEVQSATKSSRIRR